MLYDFACAFEEFLFADIRKVRKQIKKTHLVTMGLKIGFLAAAVFEVSTSNSPDI